MTQAQLTTGRYRQVAGWSSLVVGAHLLASLFNAGVTNGTEDVIEQTAPTRILPSPALADGDDVPARFLINALEANCEISPGQPLYAGQNTWVAETHGWGCQASRP